MSFDWSEYLRLAQQLAGQTTSSPSQEAQWRSPISRAYYAAFCTARNYLRDQESLSIPQSGKAHSYVRDKFHNSTDKVRRRIGQNLSRLSKDRGKADYADIVTNLPKVAEKALKQASRAIVDVNEI